MNLIKSVLIGLIGGCVGAYLAHMLQPDRVTSGPWLVLLAGLGAGLSVRVACGSSRDFMTGVGSAVASVLAIVIVSYATAAIALQSTAEMEAPLAVGTAIDTSLEEAPDETPDAAAESDEASPAIADDVPSSDEQVRPPRTAPDLPDVVLKGDSGASRQSQSHIMEMIANALSALIAFLLGTGSAGVATPSRNESSGNDDADSSD